MDATEPEAQRLRKDAEVALQQALDAGDVLPLLHRLARRAPEGSEESLFAHSQLAELVAERNPWRASLHARRVLKHRPEDDRALAALALCLTMMGHYRYAIAAYRQAVAAAPRNPWYAHNLGHLLDVAMNLPEEAVPWLVMANDAAPWSSEMAASCAHALARAGDIVRAKRVVTRAQRSSPSRELVSMMRWLAAGAPPEADRGTARLTTGEPRVVDPRAIASADAGDLDGADDRDLTDALSARCSDPGRSDPNFGSSNAEDPSAADARPAEGGPRRKAGGRRRSTGSKTARASATTSRDANAVGRVLRRGLAHLPLEAPQRSRAEELARDAIHHDGFLGEEERARDVASFAAAVAYAIIYVERIPLSQAEVAASFRVSVARLRGTFGSLRARLALTPGDERWRTVR